MNKTYIIYSIILVLLLSGIDIYLWKCLKSQGKKSHSHWWKWLLPLSSILLIGGVIHKIWTVSEGIFNATSFSNLFFGTALALFFAKIVALLVFLLEDVGRGALFSAQYLWGKQSSQKVIHLQNRRNFVKNIALGLASVPFIGTIYAITKGKYNFHTKRMDLFFERLPKAFDGFKVVQFSDFHAGSFDDIEEVKRGIDRINKEQPDLIVFTGDLVNNRAVEAEPYLSLFKNMRAKYGKVAIMGNHDYGDYIPFKNAEERKDNKKKLEDFYRSAGFRLLRNENVQINKGKDTISCIGVENWGRGHFPKYGDIHLAAKGIPKGQFKLLLSHDPDHWEYKIRELPEFFDLTLSGHTHGAQMGVSIPGWKWSPIQYRYKRWLGLYSIDKRQLFVSKGFGFLGFPGRVGMPPEIVSFRLFKG